MCVCVCVCVCVIFEHFQSYTFFRGQFAPTFMIQDGLKMSANGWNILPY